MLDTCTYLTLSENAACAYNPRMDINKIIGDNIRRLRLAAGLSQGDLAELIGTTPQRLSKYETGRDGMGKLYMERLCRALKVDLWQLTITADAPVIKDSYEMEILKMAREARELRIEEEIKKYAEYRIEDARHHGTDTDERIRRGREKLTARVTKKKAV